MDKCLFSNTTDFPLLLEYWRLNILMPSTKLKDNEFIPPKSEMIEIESCRGEWNVHRCFTFPENEKIWTDFLQNNEIMRFPETLGKFAMHDWQDLIEFGNERENGAFRCGFVNTDLFRIRRCQTENGKQHFIFEKTF